MLSISKIAVSSANCINYIHLACIHMLVFLMYLKANVWVSRLLICKLLNVRICSLEVFMLCLHFPLCLLYKSSPRTTHRNGFIYEHFIAYILLLLWLVAKMAVWVQEFFNVSSLNFTNKSKFRGFGN